ncbi:MAG: glycosyltransferase [Candidatus Poseidoniaceae archaeon]|nr:glycosyltransferase [Candidatus Poseidoniaceae archaeon]
MVLAPMVIEASLWLAATVPFARHWWSMKKWNKIQLEYPENPTLETDNCVILLPVWNESLIIEEKLSDLSKQFAGPYHLIVIDSNSTDNTVSLCNEWVDNNPDAFSSFQLIEMPVRLGKTAAVARAIGEIQEEGKFGYICMTDADATLSPKAISRLLGWFSNGTIGAVGALPRRIGSRSEEESHRKTFDSLRIAESKADSTPFLEGSCMIWRTELVSPTDLNTMSNADDAQIATTVRLKGLRSIVDESVWFEDMAPPTLKGQRRQKIRRGQGLQRLLLSKRSRYFDNRLGTFSIILRREAYFHVISPLLYGGFAIAALTRWISIAIGESPAAESLSMLHILFTTAELISIFAWANGRFGLKLPYLSPFDTVYSGSEILLLSLAKSARGQSLHMWQQHSDVRDLLNRKG